MERQFLCFLAGDDERRLLQAIDAIDPGLVVLPGRCVDTGDGPALLQAPGDFSFRQALRSRRRIYLAHRLHSERLVLHPQEEGPHAGLHCLDELRSEVMELELPIPTHGRLAPARLAATVVGHLGFERLRKGAPFGRWVGRVLRGLQGAWPRTSIDFVHLAPGAEAFAAAGGQLTYLEEEVLPAPAG